MAIEVYMKEFGETEWIDITTRVVNTGLSVREGFSSLSKGLDMGKLTITYKASNLGVAAVFHTTMKQVKVVDKAENEGEEDVVIFEGYTEGNSSVETSRSSSEAWVKVTAYPYLHILEKAKNENEIVAYNVRVSNTLNENASIVHLLWNTLLDSIDSRFKALIEDIYTVIFPSILSERSIYILEAGTSLYNELCKVLGEFNYVMWMDGFTARFSKPYADDDRRIHEIEYTDVMEKPALKTSPYIGTRNPSVTVARIISYDNEILYQQDEDKTDDNENEIELEIGQSYPDEGEADISYSSSRETEKVKFYYAKNPTIRYDAFKTSDPTTSIRITEDTLVAGGKNATVRLTNNTDSKLYVRNLEVKAGTAYFIDRSMVLEGNGEGDKAEFESNFINTEAEAQEYVNTYVSENKAETSTLTFQSAKVEGIRPNNIIAIGDIPAAYLVRSIETDVITGIKKYSCVLFSLEEIDASLLIQKGGERGSSPSDGKSAYQIAVDNGFVGTEAEWLESLKADAQVPNAFRLEVSQSTFIRNDRLTGENDYTTISVKTYVSGYEGTPSVTCNVDGILDESQQTIRIPYANAYQSITLTARLEGASDQTVVLLPVDQTERVIFYGIGVPQNATFLDGDSHYSTSVKQIKVYQNGAWVNFSLCTLSDDIKMQVLGKAQKVALENNDAKEYGYFNVLIADYVQAMNVGANTITLTGENGKLVGGDQTLDGSYLKNKGVYLDSDGNSRLTDAYINSAHIKDANAENLTITGKSSFNGDLSITEEGNTNDLLIAQRKKVVGSAVSGAIGTTPYFSMADCYSTMASKLSANSVVESLSTKTFDATERVASSKTTLTFDKIVKFDSATKVSASVSNGGTRTLPFNATVTVTSGTSSTYGAMNGGDTLTCPSKWNISSLYNAKTISENSLKTSSSGYSYAGNAITKYARITDKTSKAESDTVVRNVTNSARETGTNTYTYKATADCTVYVELCELNSQMGDFVGYQLYLDGSWKALSYGSVTVLYGGIQMRKATVTMSVKKDSVVRIDRTAGSESGGSGNFSTVLNFPSEWYEKLSLIGKTFEQIGLNENGVWAYYSSAWNNLGTSTEYDAANRLILAGFDSNTLTSASFTYVPRGYTNGVNLLNGYTSVLAVVPNDTRWYTGTFKVTKSTTTYIDASASTISKGYKFAGLNSTSGTATKFSGTPTVSWTKVDGTGTSGTVASITWKTAYAITMVNTSGTSFSIAANDLFTKISISFTPLGRDIGVFTQNITPLATDTYTIGDSASVRFKDIYAKNFHGTLDGNASSANGVTPEWSGSIAISDTNWICAWNNDGNKIKALSKGDVLTVDSNNTTYIRKFRDKTSPRHYPYIGAYQSSRFYTINLPTANYFPSGSSWEMQWFRLNVGAPYSNSGHCDAYVSWYTTTSSSGVYSMPNCRVKLVGNNISSYPRFGYKTATPNVIYVDCGHQYNTIAICDFGTSDTASSFDYTKTTVDGSNSEPSGITWMTDGGGNLQVDRGYAVFG